MTWTGNGLRPLDTLAATTTAQGRQWVARVGHNLLVVLVLHPQPPEAARP